MNHESTIPNSSSVNIKEFNGKITLSQSVNNPGVKMLDFKSELKPQADDNAKLIDYNSAFHGLAMKITFDEGKITCISESEMKDLKDRIQERDDLIEDLTKKLAALSSDNSSKESKITEQSKILAKSRKHIQFLENQISENLETSEMTMKALRQEKDTFKSNSRQLEVQVSELETEVQNKVNSIYNLETKVAELTNEVATKVKANEQLQQDHNQLEKKSISLEAKISDLDSQRIGKLKLVQQSYKSLISTQGNAQSTVQEPKVEINEMIMVDHFNIKLKLSDLNRLRGLSWLNDEIITFI